MAATFFILKSGLAPAGLSARPESERLRYWNFVVEYGLKRKDWELARGLNAKGEPLPGVALATRKNRRSEMTPSGKGDPSAPYLMPGRGLSRTRSLLTGRARTNYAEFWWQFDVYTGDQWGKVLAAHARRGKSYDVVGLSPKGVAWVKVQAEKAWRAWIAAGKPVAPVLAPAEPRPIERVGRTNLEFATFGIGGDKESSQKAIDEGRSSGFLSAEEWAKHFRSRRPAIAPRPGQAPSVSKGASNVILQHVWSGPKPPPPTTLRKAAMPPAAPPKPKAPPKAKPTPVEPTPRPEPVYRRIETEAEAVAWGERHYAGTLADLTPKQRDEIWRYSGSSFAINQYLRGQARSRPLDAEAIPDLDAATTAKPLPEDMILYRGLGELRPVLKSIGIKSITDLEVGMYIIDPGFTSTTVLREKAFGGVLMEIRARKGTAGVWFGEASALPGEREVLLAREVDVFRVVEIRSLGEIVVEAVSSREIAAADLAKLIEEGRLKP